jgi:phosphopantothenoylcysteine synthetase/decarboxylase
MKCRKLVAACHATDHAIPDQDPMERSFHGIAAARALPHHLWEPGRRCLRRGPATFNTVNKIAHGISDTLAVGLVCEGLGNGLPVIIAPWLNRPLTRHGAYRRSLDHLPGHPR